MPPTPYKPAKVTKTSAVTYKLGPVRNIVVLVSGTTDPINAAEKKPSHSYRSAKVKPGASDPDWYWKYEYKGRKSTLFDDVKKLEDELKKYNVALFSAHGWSGDNAAQNREVSGGYLVDRLCGSNGEEPYYQKYLKEEVHFHLVGHSHGGNVINEMTKRMARCEEWPAKWSVKTIVYLSTPFFKKLHQLDPKALHPGCEIGNVFNKYDLTQRVVADFSLHQLTGVMDVTGTSMEDITGALRKITGWKPDPRKPEDAGKKEIKGFNLDKATDGLSSIRLRDFDDRDWHTDWTWAMSATGGAAMYEECIALFKNINALIDAVKAVITSLNAKLEFKVVKSLEGKIVANRKVVSDLLKARFHEKLDTLKAGLTPTIKAFEARLKSKRYPASGLLADLYLDRFLRPIVDFIAVGAPGPDGRLAAPFAGSLLDLLHDLLFDQVDVFDDTSQTPAAQLAKTPFKAALVSINVTTKDAYRSQRDVAYGRFIKHLEDVEDRYFTAPSKADLLDLVFTLLAQVEAIQTMIPQIDSLVTFLSAHEWVEIVSRLGDDAFEEIIKDLLSTVRSYRTILKGRDFGGLVVAEDQEDTSKEIFKRGDLNYLMRVSHSVSREALYDQVKALLVQQIKT